ncbi:pisatin demethylase [Xylariaceae sp. FL0016]|nr:pisatin demethylase [Xylariaceae sp. FL0016]
MELDKILLGLLVAAWVHHTVRAYLSLREFGGHWSAGWSRLWLFRTQSSGEMHRQFQELNDRYGSTARIAPRMLITSDPGLVSRMNAVRSDFCRGPWYAALQLHPDQQNITSLVDEEAHAQRRTRMTPGYGGKDNPNMEQDIDGLLLQFLDLINNKYLTNPTTGPCRPMDLAEKTSFLTLDVISKLAFGSPLGFLSNDKDPYGYMANLEQMLPAVIVFGVFTELTWLLKLPFIKPFLPSSSDKRGLGSVMGFASGRVAERFAASPDGKPRLQRRDMISSFIHHGLTQPQLEAETLTQITAGSDSTASALRLTVHHVSTCPPVLERLLNELRAGIGESRISRPVIRDEEARKLPYLQACIKESLRMYPPVTGLMAKQVPAGGATLRVDRVDKFAPGGTQIAWNPWGMMRRKEIFGEDCEIFRPERWLPLSAGEEGADRIQRMSETVGLCFGAGRFGCLGRGVAVMELNKAVPEMLIRYNFQPCDLVRPFDQLAVGFYLHRNMQVVVTERDGSGEDAGRSDVRAYSGMDAGSLLGAPEE